MSDQSQIENHGKRTIRMIEFFSGIGGMRCAAENALKTLDVELATCQAYEISLYANETYRNNFRERNGCCRVYTKLVEQLTVDNLPEADLWTMSPPCQPFTNTRFAKQRDLTDKRNRGFLALQKLLLQLPRKPMWILLENVKGFAKSETWTGFQQTLVQAGYSFQPYLLSPIQLGIPNHRMRFYVVCELSDRFFGRSNPPSLPVTPIENPPRQLTSSVREAARTVEAFVDPILFNLDDFLLKESTLMKSWASGLGVVTIHDCQSHCFTSAYGRQLHMATGSLLLMNRDTSIEDDPLDKTDMTKYIGNLRRFAPSELLRLFGFPLDFSFPSTIPLEHQYKLVGNSVSVFVISELLIDLLQDPCTNFPGAERFTID